MYLRPTIANVALTTADTEYSYTVPQDTRKLLLKSRNAGDIKLAYASGESGTTYITINAGSTGKWLDASFLRGVVLYMQSPDGSDVAEIEIWK